MEDVTSLIRQIALTGREYADDLKRINERLDKIERIFLVKQEAERHVPTEAEMVKEINNSAYGSLRTDIQNLNKRIYKLEDQVEELEDMIWV